MPADVASLDPDSLAESRPELLPLGRRFLVDPTERLAHLDSPRARAFAAIDKRRPERQAFALVCEAEAMPRYDALQTLNRMEPNNFLVPLDWNIIDWPGDGMERFVVCFHRPAGERLFSAESGGRRAPMRPDDVVSLFVAPLLGQFDGFLRSGTPHRAIRGDNVFLDAATGQVQLGECVSAAPAACQQALFETIESAMCDPGCRTAGGSKDDLYSFGILLALLLLGENPLARLSDHEIIARKLEVGSYAALIEKGVPLGRMMEPLRGLLTDDSRERWNLGDLELWLGGRSLSPKQAALPPKAKRSILVGDAEYWNTRSLAHGLAQDWPLARRVVMRETLSQWVERSLENQGQASHVMRSLKLASEGELPGADQVDQAVARVLIHLDPEAPIRFKGLSVSIESLGPAFAVAYDDPGKWEAVVELVASQLPAVWLEAQGSAMPEHVLMKRGFDEFAEYLNSRDWGFGPERCLYLSNPFWPCRSPLLAQKLVFRTEHVLPALEERARTAAQGAEMPIDRDLVAFCAARLKGTIDAIVPQLSESQPGEIRAQALLRFFGAIERDMDQTGMSSLAGWIVSHLDSLFEAFGNRHTRKRLRQEVGRHVEKGEIAKIQALLLSDEALAEDRHGAASAKQELIEIGSEMAWLRDGGLTRPHRVSVASRQIAFLTCSLLSGLALFGLSIAMVL